MNKIIFLSDFFLSDITGGGELNDHELTNMFLSRGFDLKKVRCREVTLEFLKQNIDSFFIVSNFATLSGDYRDFLLEKVRYVIYEHDHKYLQGRNPARYEGYRAPPNEIINKDFYSRAECVFCQSTLHKNIIDRNLNDIKTISLSGNLWSIECLKKIRQFSHKEKNGKAAVMYSQTEHKGTAESIKYCKFTKKTYDILYTLPYYEFLDKLSNYSRLVFFPKTPETLSRLCVESKMLNLKITTNKNVGAAHEEWFSLSGVELIDFMSLKRGEIFKKVKDFVL